MVTQYSHCLPYAPNFPGQLGLVVGTMQQSPYFYSYFLPFFRVSAPGLLSPRYLLHCSQSQSSKHALHPKSRTLNAQILTRGLHRYITLFALALVILFVCCLLPFFLQHYRVVGSNGASKEQIDSLELHNFQPGECEADDALCAVCMDEYAAGVELRVSREQALRGWRVGRERVRRG